MSDEFTEREACLILTGLTAILSIQLSAVLLTLGVLIWQLR